MVFPRFNFEPNSKGEDYVWKKFIEILPTNYVSFHNYYIDTQEADVIVLVPDAGILIIEIKGFYPQNVLDTIDNSNIILKNGNVERSPYKQSRRYRNQLIEKLNETDPELAKHIIAVSICFPYFSEHDITEKHLDRLVNRDLIISGEDLRDRNSLSLKFIKIFEKTNEVWIPDNGHNRFDINEVKQVAEIFVPGFSFETIAELPKEPNKNNDYSLFVSQKESKEDVDLVNELYEEWKKGVKVFFYSSCEKNCESLKERAKKFLKDNSLEKLIFEDGEVFNLIAQTVDGISENVRVVNGEELVTHLGALEEIGLKANFNFEQYKAEHAACDDMVVRAGAGTGKTYLLVSRIAYLCWKNEYSCDDLKYKIILITFTNDATDEMRARLVQYFSNMFRLTFDLKYFSFAEAVENMNISTIDSFGKKIISRFAFYLGLGSDLSVTTGTMIKQEAIRKALNSYAESNGLISSSYLLEKFMLQIVDKLGNRSADAKELEQEFIRACSGEPILGELIKEIPSVISEIEKNTEDKNQIPMSHIIIYLRRIVNMMKDSKLSLDLDNNIEYLFIDEFQDTDDTQIELVADFKSIYGFKLFVVGDPKQSIYRFRGASDDRAFDVLNEKIGYKIREFSLVKNYRSNAKLLDFMDKSFSKLSRMNGLLKYTNRDKLIGVKNKSVPSIVKRYDISSDEDREKEIINILQDFRDGALDGETLAILVRSNAEVEKIRDICFRHNIIDVDIDTGGKLYRSEAVIDLYKLLLALQNYGDSACLFNLYTTSYCNESLKKKELANSNNCKEYFNQHIPESLEKWNIYIESIQKEPILKTIRTIIDDVKPWQIYAQRCNVKDDVKGIYELRYKNNIDKLFEKIAIENNGSYLTLSSLLDFLKIMITTHQEEDEGEIESSLQIQCRTVHRAKGKEYTYVFFPFGDERIKKEKFYGDTNFVYLSGNVGYSFKDKDMDSPIENEQYSDLLLAELNDQSFEEARIFYVAVTRAKKGIIYINNQGQKNRKAVLWQQLLGE